VGSGTLESMTFALDPLRGHEIEASLATLLDGDVPAGLADGVSDWSGGNPLFLEEIVAHLIETGVLQREDGHWQLLGDLRRARPPATVSALLAARLGQLPPGELDLLERVSVIGLEFSTDDAGLLAGPATGEELEGLLMSLTRRDLVRRVRSTGGDSWAFKHILVRDAAYDGLAKSTRAKLHERFADASWAREAAVGNELTGFVAHHLEQAARYRRELAARGPEVDALVDRAVAALVLAAEQARDADRLMDHGSYLNRAVRLAPRSSRTRRRLLAGLVDHYLDLDAIDHLGDALDAFETELDDAADGLDRALLGTMRLYRELMSGRSIDPAVVASAAQELVALGRAAPDASSVVRGLRVTYQCLAAQGLWRDADVVTGEIIRIGSAADARDARSGEYLALLFGEGTFRECQQILSREFELHGASEAQGWSELVLVALIAAADHSPATGEAIAAASARGEELRAAGRVSEDTHPFLIDAFAMSGDLDGAIEYAQRVNDNLRRSGALIYASTYVLTQALFMLERGQPRDAATLLLEEAEDYTSPYDASSVARGSACRALIALRAGDHAQAVGLADEALRVIDRTQETWAQADLRRWLSEVPRTVGDTIVERTMLLEARARYARKGIRSYDTEINARLAELDRG